jgi:hypothetical protein
MPRTSASICCRLVATLSLRCTTSCRSGRLKAVVRINTRVTGPSWQWRYWARTSTTASPTSIAGTSTAPRPSVSYAPMLRTLSKVCWQEHPAPSRQWLRDYLQDFRNGSQRRSLPGSSDPQNNWLSIDLMTLSELATESGRANGWTVRIRNNYHSEQFITPRKLPHYDRSPSLQQTPTQEKAPR